MNLFFISVFVPCSILLPFVTGLIHIVKLHRQDRILLIYITISGLVNLGVSILAHYSINNLPVLHVFTVVEFVLLSFFFNAVYQDRRYSRLSFILMGVFSLLSLLNTLFIQSIFIFNTYARSLEALILICYCLYFYYQVLRQERHTSGSAIWQVSGIFLYFSTSFILFIVSNIAEIISKQQDWILWNIHGGMVLLMYIFITIGFYIGQHGR